MDLPTYTNIWRIEKRLYKLYDLRLPMPLPIVWIGVFVGVSAFWWVLLHMVGLPFDAPWHVIYLVPPGIVTWLSTRPVIESKRLTELLQSQARYLSEPKTWCRLAPSGEPDVIDFQAKVWRASTASARVKKPKRAPEPQRATVRPAVAAAAAAATPLVEEIPVRVKPPLTATAAAHAEPRLMGHPDDKQSYPGDPAEQLRRPASFGQPPRLARPVGERPAAISKDPSRPFAGSPLRPAFLAHPSDKPQPKTPERQPAARPDVPSHSAAESAPASQRPSDEVRPARPAARRPEASGMPSHSAEGRPQSQPADVSSHSAAEGAPDSQRPLDETQPARPVARRDMSSHSAAEDRPQSPPADRSAMGSVPRSQARHVPASQVPPEATESAPRSQAPEGDTRPVHRGEAKREVPGAPALAVTRAQVPEEDTRPVPRREAKPEVPALPATASGLESRAPGGSSRSVSRDEVESALPTTARGAESRVPEERPRSVSRDEVESALPATASGVRSPVPGEDRRPDSQGEMPASPAAESVTRFKGPAVPSRPPGEGRRRRHAADDVLPQVPGLPAPSVGESTASRQAAEVTVSEGASPAEAEGPRLSWSPVPRPKQAAPDAGVPQVVPEEQVAEGRAEAARGGRHAAGETPDVAVPPARVEDGPAEPGREVAGEHAVPAPGQPAAEEVSSPPIRPDALRRLRRLAASADSAVEPEAPAPAVDWQKERLRKGQPPTPFIPAERGSEATWRRVSQVVAGSDGDNDEDRARTAINGSRRIVVLGCTGGAGQTTTTLLLGHSLARLREDGVVAVDANSGGDGLTGRIVPETAETLSSFLTAVDSVGTRVRGYTTRTESGLDVLAADVDPGAEQRIGDRGWFSDQRIARAMRLLDQQYRIILMDPAAALAARLLPYADQLVLVAPASADAPDSVAMTYDWLDGHGCADLRRRAVVVINGVSRRSMADVERAETVARGRCRAIVRVPWEDELAEPGQVDLNDLRSGGRRAYVALAGVVASGLTTARGESFVG